VNSRHSIIPGHCGDVVWFHVEGAGSRENSADVARYAQPEIERGKRSFVVDLADCTSLDSTFMGMLIGLAQQVRQDVEGCLHVINARGRNAQLLRGLGVHYFCSVSEDDGPFAQSTNGCDCAEATGPTRSDVVYDEELEHLDLSKKELTEHCLEAHTKLCEAGKENKEKFQHVVELMEQKLVQLQQ
jgi:anti-sigma B factor antagonist